MPLLKGIQPSAILWLCKGFAASAISPAAMAMSAAAPPRRNSLWECRDTQCERRQASLRDVGAAGLKRAGPAIDMDSVQGRPDGGNADRAYVSDGRGDGRALQALARAGITRRTGHRRFLHSRRFERCRLWLPGPSSIGCGRSCWPHYKN